jgi:hypothetical protein
MMYPPTKRRGENKAAGSISVLDEEELYSKG